MPRSVMLSCAALALALLPSCRPSKAEFAALQGELSAMHAEQTEMGQRIEALSDQETNRQNADRYERAELENAVIDLAVRVAQLEERLAETEKRNKPRPSSPRPDSTAVYKVEIGDAPIKGPPTALVTIVMWTDYQCPYCARVQPTLRELEEVYGRKIRLVHKHNPLGFHPRAMPAALAAEAARRQGKFWKMNRRLFENQKELTDKNFIKWAKKIGLDVRRFKKDIKDKAIEKHIKADQAQGMTLGARGTPAFFVNGRFLSGAQPLANFRTLIDEEMDKARALVDKGVAPKKVYEVTIAEGRTKI